MTLRTLALLSVRNEGAFLLEWLAHHRACGFTDVIACSNDCTDGTDVMLDRLAQAGHLVHLPNPGPYPQGVHFGALKRAAQHPLMQAADWILSFDVDEFVNIHVGNRSIGALIAALPEATAIALTWRMFGNAGIVNHPRGGVLPAFTRSAPRVLHWPWRARMFKTLYRNDGTYLRPGIHRPRDRDSARLPPRWFDGSGRALPARYHDRGLLSAPGTDTCALAQMNHYALGAVEDFLLKRDRGRANRDDGTSALAYWVDRNFCAETDTTIKALAPERAAILGELRSDPVLLQLEQGARDWRRVRLGTLLGDPDWRALYGQLLMTPESRVLTEAEAARLRRPTATGAHPA